MLLDGLRKIYYKPAMEAATDLVHEAQSRLRQAKGRWPQIAAQAGLSHSWLVKLCAGDIQNPGYRTLQSVLRAIDDVQRTEATS